MQELRGQGESATSALRLYRTGRHVTYDGWTRQIIGSALGMELARDGRHKKLVLYVKLAAVLTNNRKDILSPEMIVPHYCIDSTTVQR